MGDDAVGYIGRIRERQEEEEGCEMKCRNVSA